MKNKRLKKLISHLLIVTFIMCITMDNFAEFVKDIYGITRYVSESGTYAINCWRWIDMNGDGICECYRFDENGFIAANYTSKDGKKTNEQGQWVVDGKVKQIYRNTGKPVYQDPGLEGQKDQYDLIRSTDSVTGSVSFIEVLKERRLVSGGASDKVKNQENKNGLGDLSSGPQFLYEGPGEKGFLSKGKIDKSPKFIATRGQVITTIKLEEDEPRYVEGTSSFVRQIGRDMRKFDVLASKKYTEKMENVNIWGGETWEDVFCLAGNGAYVKFDLKGYNYMRVEIAHQTHGESTADTDCRVELYLDNNLVTFYDDFNDYDPEVVEEWFDEGEKTITLKAVITGDAPGRKIYFRNGRFRRIKEKVDD